MWKTKEENLEIMLERPIDVDLLREITGDKWKTTHVLKNCKRFRKLRIKADKSEELKVKDLYAVYKQALRYSGSTSNFYVKGIGEECILAMDKYLLHCGAIFVPYQFYHLPVITRKSPRPLKRHEKAVMVDEENIEHLVHVVGVFETPDDSLIGSLLYGKECDRRSKVVLDLNPKSIRDIQEYQPLNRINRFSPVDREFIDTIRHTC
jgi:hypothetical protein